MKLNKIAAVVAAVMLPFSTVNLPKNTTAAAENRQVVSEIVNIT